MGQYWIPVNLDKKECISPHKLGSGLKLWEQLANYPGVGGALIVLTAAMPEPRGGGDFDMTSNWHGPERTFPEHNLSPGPMPTDYPSIARQVIGRWAGDRIAIVGDYAEPDDLPDDDASVIFEKCSDAFYEPDKEGNEYTDISDLVCAVIEHELQGKFVGTGWRDFKYDRELEGENG
jgi:hypothetical protein